MKKNILSTILCLIFLIIFNLIFYMTGGTVRPVSVWISYGFIHIAYLFLVCTTLFVKPGENAALFGMTLGAVSGVYFIVELIVGSAFILIASEGYKACVIVHAVITGIYVIILIINILANDTTATAQKRHNAEVNYLKETCMILHEIMEQVGDKSARKKVEKLYDLMQSSPAKSRRDVQELEFQIIESLEQLNEKAAAINSEEVERQIEKIQRLARERNRRLRLSN